MEFVAAMSTLDVFEHSRNRGPSVDMSEEPTIDELWDSALRSKGFVDPRSGEPSISALAYKIGVGKSTISRMRAGTRTPKQTTIAKVADALGVFPTEVARWVGQARELSTAYMPPPEADLLNERERRAVDEMIRLFAESKLTTSIEASGEGTATVTAIGVQPARDAETKAALAGESDELRRRRLTKAPEDVSQDPDDHDR